MAHRYIYYNRKMEGCTLKIRNPKGIARQIKKEGLWLDVRNQYVCLKEMYLSRWWDKDHPSFVVYIEAVNNVYSKNFI